MLRFRVIDTVSTEFPATGDADVDETGWETDGMLFSAYFITFKSDSGFPAILRMMKFIDKYSKGQGAHVSYTAYGDNCPIKAPYILFGYFENGRHTGL